MTVGLCTAEKLAVSSGRPFLRARLPDLYGKLVEPSAEPPMTASGWPQCKPRDA